MRLKMIFLSVAQALMLDYAPQRSLCVAIQCTVPLLDTRVPRTLCDRTTVLFQGVLYAASLLLPLLALHMDPVYGNSGAAALVRTTAPLWTLLIVPGGLTQWRRWLAALVSWLGLYVAVWPHTLSGGAVSAHLLLVASTACGVLLGAVQQQCGACWREMSLVASIIATLNFAATSHLVSTDVAASLLFVLAYGALSFLAQRAVREFQIATRHRAYDLTMALNERRAITVMICAFRDQSGVALARTLGGGAIALVGSMFGAID